MAKWTRVPAIVAVLAVAACGGGGSAVDPGSIENCDAVVDAAIDVIEDFVEAAEDLTLADLAAAEQTTPAVVESREAADALTARAVELGCSLDEVNAEITERAADVEVDPDNLVGLFFRNAVTSPETDLLE